MQKITRIYVGNYGIDMAWYDGITLDLTDPDTQEPTDTIINLENGGGKTTLLSFIFSCFDTPQERFLKHLQNRNHRFGQYFSRDGMPGVVLVEWQMPPRVAGGDAYRLVVGQVVSVKPETDRINVDRVFFSFLPTGSLTFESVPAPKLNLAPALTMAEFARWMQEGQKLDSTFFHTRVQQDWQQHLRDERFIDLEMLRLQVNFSTQEGGIDTGFLTFNSESEFLRKLLALTLDPERAAAVRQNVTEICDKLRRKPFYQRQLTELTTLQASLSQFHTHARAYEEAQSVQEGAVKQGAAMVLSLNARTAQKTRLAETETANKSAHEQRRTEKEAEEKEAGARWVVLNSLQHARKLEAAKGVTANAVKEYNDARNKLKCVKAAKARTELTELEAEKKSLEDRAAQEAQQLLPWRETVERCGALLRRGLFTEESRLRDASALEKARADGAREQRGELNAELESLSMEETRLVKEHASLEAAEQTYLDEHERLTTDGTLEAGETSKDALSRWTEQERLHRQAERTKRDEAAAHRAAEKKAIEQAHVETATAARNDAAAEKEHEFIAKGDAEQEALAQLPILRQAAESDTADPDSPALLLALERLTHSYEREISLCDVGLAELRASRSSIEETGVAGASRDVNDVVSCLLAAGVRSAKAYNTYIAQAIPDAFRARALVASNPARFFGVCVSDTEFEKARVLEQSPPQLNSPVCVSIAALDAEVSPAHTFVLSAADDARFNTEAAQLLLAELERKVKDEEERRGQYSARLNEASAARHRIGSYLATYGAEKLNTAREKATKFESEAVLARGRAAQAMAAVEEHRQLAQACADAAEDSAREALKAHRELTTIERFVRVHEDGRPARNERLTVISSRLKGISERRSAIQNEHSQLEVTANSAYQRHVELGQEARNLEVERGDIKYYDKQFDAASSLAEKPQTLPVLRQDYKSAADTYELEERDRLGALHQQLESARRRWNESAQEFSKQFSSIKYPDFAPYLRENFDVLIPQTEGDIEIANQAQIDAKGAEAIAKDRSKQFHSEYMPSSEPTMEMLALDEAALVHTIDEVANLRRECLEQKHQAIKAAEHAGELVKQAMREAKTATSFAKVIVSSLSLPDLLVADPIDLLPDIEGQAQAIIQEFNERSQSVRKAHDAALKSFDALKTAAGSKSLYDVEPDLAVQLQRNTFEAACADSERLLSGIIDRIGATQSNLDNMQKDFDNCVGELSNLVNSALALLNSAIANKKVPVGAPYVGGKSIIKMRARFGDIPHDARRLALEHYLDTLIDTNVVPMMGSELVADAILRVHGKPLGLQMLKMVPDENLQYVPVDKIQNSGGEGVVMAMFLYLLITQLRSETQAKLKKTGGGPLILDNPFAKATTPTLWRAQRMLAQSMDVQLIFATALPDYNTVGEFTRFNRLRKAGKNTKTGRWHLEVADFKIQPHEFDAAAAL